MRKYIETTFTNLLHEVGVIWLFSVQVLRTFFTTQGNFAPIMAQIASVTVRSLVTVIFAGVFVGAILVLQLNLILEKYDAQTFLGGLNTSTVVREVGPLFISFMLAGKIGAFTAAELGTMRVTEQIDAIECLGTNPIQYLIVPRMVGIIFSSLILLFIGMLVSIAGSMAVASFSCGINYLEFAATIPRFTNIWTVLGAMMNAVIFGIIVAGVSCQKGYTASGGARGVGRAVTNAAIYTNLYIVVADFITSNLLGFVGRLAETYRGITS